jgi:hypothetical protein
LLASCFFKGFEHVENNDVTAAVLSLCASASVVFARPTAVVQPQATFVMQDRGYGPIDGPYAGSAQKGQDRWIAEPVLPFTWAEKRSYDRNSSNVDGGGGG